MDMHDQAIQKETVLTKTAQELTALLVNVRDNGDKSAFAELFNHFAPRVKSYVLKLGSNEIMAEEIAQQTLLQVWRKAHLFDSSKAVASTWIFRIARNLRLDLIRKEKHYDYDDYDFTQIEDERDSQETNVERQENAAIVENALRTLPPEQVEIIHLSFYQGLSHSQIAEELSLPLGTVKSRVRLAFKRIKEAVGEVL